MQIFADFFNYGILTHDAKFEKKTILVIFALLLSFGCAGNSALVAEALSPADGYGEPVQCDGGCVRPWQRAQLWLVAHAGTPIAFASDVLLQTYETTHNDRVYSFAVIKNPLQPDGRYRIELQISCGNLLGWCSPDESSVRKAFFYYVQTGNDLLRGKISVHNAIR